jgi:hypothetical protein
VVVVSQWWTPPGQASHVVVAQVAVPTAKDMTGKTANKALRMDALKIMDFTSTLLGFE